MLRLILKYLKPLNVFVFFLSSFFPVAPLELRAFSAPVGAEKMETLPLDPEQDWIAPEFDLGMNIPPTKIYAIGRITKIVERSVYSEDRRVKKREKRELQPGSAILLKPNDVREATSSSYEPPQGFSGTSDYVWLRNGDEFPCEFAELDKRFAYLRAFGFDVKIPRGRIAVIRFRSRQRD